MRALILLSMMFISSCASHRTEQKIPPFDKDIVCSQSSLSYINKYKEPISKPRYSSKDTRPRTEALEPAIKSCYRDEMFRTQKESFFNLCLVAGWNKKGEQEFFEFSTSEIQMSPELKKCLSDLKTRKEMQGLKDITIIQPYRLYPRQP